MKKVFFFVPMILIFSFFGLVSGKIGGGDITFRPQKAKEVIFRHESHVSEIGIKCTDCHDRLYTTKGKHKGVTMAEMRRGFSCGACHDGKKAFDVRANCSNCHKKD